MYKLILVDDEEEVRKGVINKIEWDKYGFEVVGEAENGREALEIAEKCVPDVVITDIKMPFLDGIALSKQLMESFPTTKVIILTGFDEFEYAQKAIKLNVMEYVLKPIASSELISILKKVKCKLDEEIEKRKDVEALRKYYKESLPVLREKFLTSLITTKLKKDEIEEKAKNYGIDLSGDAFIISVLSMDTGNRKETESFDRWEEKELLKFAVIDTSKQIAQKHHLGIVFFHKEYIVIITIFDKNDPDQVMNKTVSLLEEIRLNIEKFLKFTVTIGVGTVCNDINYIKNSYEQAVAALDYRLVIGNNRIIWIEDVEPNREEKILFDESKEYALASSIKVGTIEELQHTVDQLFEEIIYSKVSLHDCQIYLFEMLTAILKAAKSANVDMKKVFDEHYNLFVELNKFKYILEIKNWFLGICIKIMHSISTDRQAACKLLVEQAKDYVKTNYHDMDLTIDKICKHLHISSSYFSSIFKRETENTFIKYLTQIRMEAAKELLRTTDLKSFEIAERVGYSEPNYFSYSFKKSFGISPLVYKNSFKRGM